MRRVGTSKLETLPPRPKLVPLLVWAPEAVPRDSDIGSWLYSCAVAVTERPSLSPNNPYTKGSP